MVARLGDAARLWQRAVTLRAPLEGTSPSVLLSLARPIATARMHQPGCALPDGWRSGIAAPRGPACRHASTARARRSGRPAAESTKNARRTPRSVLEDPLRDAHTLAMHAPHALAPIDAARTAVAEQVGTVVGLDVSTRNTGYAVLAADTGRVLEHGTIRAPSSGDILDMGALISDTLAELHAEYGVGAVAVEDYMKSFAPGKFHTRGLFKLAQLNGIVAYESRRVTAAESPVFHMPNAIRAFFGVRGGAKRGASPGDEGSRDGCEGGGGASSGDAAGGVKDAVMRRVNEHQPGMKWELGRGGQLSPRSYDAADAVLVALYNVALRWQAAMLANDSVMEQYLTAYLTPYAPRVTRRGAKIASAAVTSADSAGHDATAEALDALTRGALFHAAVRDHATAGVEAARVLLLDAVSRRAAGAANTGDEASGAARPKRKKKGPALSAELEQAARLIGRAFARDTKAVAKHVLDAGAG